MSFGKKSQWDKTSAWLIQNFTLYGFFVRHALLTTYKHFSIFMQHAIIRQKESDGLTHKCDHWLSNNEFRPQNTTR